MTSIAPTHSIRRQPGRIVAIVAAAGLGLGFAGITTARALEDPEPDVYFYFTDASPLIEGNDVKAGGVKVGTIGSIEVDQGKARVGLVLDDAVLPLHDDATARIRPVGLLGERFVEIDRGSPDAPVLGDGAELDVDQSSTATDLDRVLDTVDGPTGTALALLVTTLGEGMTGRGQDAQAAIEALAPALEDTDRLASILDDQNEVLIDLLDSVRPVAEGLASNKGQDLEKLVEYADATLQATATHDAQLSETLSELPGTLTETRATLRTLAAAADSTTPVLRALRPTTDDLRQLSIELSRFSRSAQPALDGLDPVMQRADALLDRARPVVTLLRQLSPDLRSTAENGGRVVRTLLDNLDQVMEFVKNWSLTTNGQDGLSHYFRANLVVTEDIATGPLPGAGGTQGGQTETLGEGVTDTLDDALEDALDQLPMAGGILDGLSGANNSEGGLGSLPGLGRKSSRGVVDGGSATGLTTQQEKSLLAYLIGGTHP